RRGRPKSSGRENPWSHIDQMFVAFRRLCGKPPAVGHDQVCGWPGWASRQRNRKAVADPAVRQKQTLFTTLHRNRRKQIRDRRARADDIAYGDTTIASGREAARSAAVQVVAHDADLANAV